MKEGGGGGRRVKYSYSFIETECTPVMTVQTKHEGRGKFEFFYHFGVSYAVKVCILGVKCIA